jgi:hypothetical protein
MDVLPELIEQAMDGTLDAASYASLWRTRRSHMPYLRTLMHRLEASDGHDRILARFCRQVAQMGNRPLFAKKLAELKGRGVEI